MTDTKVVQIPNTENKQKIYSNPEMATIIIDQIAALKKRTALAEEQLNLLLLKNTDEVA